MQRVAPRASLAIGMCSTIDLPLNLLHIHFFFKSLCAGWVSVCVGVCMYVGRCICKCVVETRGQCQVSLIASPPLFSDRVSQ